MFTVCGKTNKEMNEDDNYTRIFRKIIIGFFELSITKCFLQTISLEVGICCIVQTYLFLYRFDLQYFIKYGPSYIIALYMLMCTVLLPHFVNVVTSIVKDVNSFKVQCKDETVMEMNRKISINCTTYLIANIGLAIAASTCFALPSKFDEDVFYCLRLFQEFTPNIKIYLTYLYKLCLIPMAVITAIFPTCNIIYMFLEYRCQVNILIHYIGNIDSEYKNRDTLNSTDQAIIEENLLFCVKLHIDISRAARKVIKEVPNVVLSFQVLGTLLMASIVILVFTIQEEVLLGWRMRLVTLTVAAFFTLAGLAFGGQNIEDLSSDIFDTLHTVEWHKWNVSNRKSYLMILTNSLKPFRLKYSENHSLNYKLGIEVVKAFFPPSQWCTVYRNPVRNGTILEQILCI